VGRTQPFVTTTSTTGTTVAYCRGFQSGFTFYFTAKSGNTLPAKSDTAIVSYGA